MTWREMLDALAKAQADGEQRTPRVIYPKADEKKVGLRLPKARLLRLLEKDAQMEKERSHASVRNTDWTITQNDNGRFNLDQVNLSLLMDIRSELLALNRLLACPNFTGIPRHCGRSK